MTMAIEITDVTVKFPSRDGTVVALDNVSFSVETGQVCAFLGPNGAGKTTAVHVLLGFVQPSSGTATVLGEDVSKSIARRRIGYLPEHPNTYGFLTGGELLALTGKLFGMRRRQLSTRVCQVLDTLNMSFAADRKIATYSRGMMQRICLAQALIKEHGRASLLPSEYLNDRLTEEIAHAQTCPRESETHEHEHKH